MDRDVIRLECIKLAVQRVPDHKDAVARAKDYFEFVTEKDAPQNNNANAGNSVPGVSVTAGKRTAAGPA